MKILLGYFFQWIAQAALQKSYCLLGCLFLFIYFLFLFFLIFYFFLNTRMFSRSVVSDSLRPMDYSLPGSFVHGIFQARIFLTQELNPHLLCLLHCRQILYLLSHWGRSLGRGHGNPLQYSWLENSMDRGAWRAVVHRAAQSQTWLKQFSIVY